MTALDAARRRSRMKLDFTGVARPDRARRERVALAEAH